MELDYVNIFLTLPNPLNVFETTFNSPISNLSSSESVNSDSNSNENHGQNTCNINNNNIGNDNSNSIADPDEENSSESELTNLAWLTEIKNIGNLPLQETTTHNNPTIRFNKFMSDIQKSKETFDQKSYSFRTNPNEKPPFNYAHIIGMAMMDREMMTLKDICNWIRENFAYYKSVGNWNNSIRHNLSLSVFFTKVARDKNEKGKGGYWKLAMDYTKTEKKRIRRSNKSNSSNINNNNNNNNIKNKNHNKTSPTNCLIDKMPKPDKCVNKSVKKFSSQTSSSSSINNDEHQIENLNQIDDYIEIVNDCTGCSLSPSNDDDEENILQNNCISLSEIEIIDMNSDGSFVYNMDVCLNDVELNSDGCIITQNENYYENVITTSSLSSPSSTTHHLQQNHDNIISNLNNLNHEIFLESDIPQPIDEIALPFVFNLPQNGPNVITETIPQFTNLPGLDTIDNSDFSSIKFNEYDELDKFLNLNQDFI